MALLNGASLSIFSSPIIIIGYQSSPIRSSCIHTYIQIPKSFPFLGLYALCPRAWSSIIIRNCSPHSLVHLIILAAACLARGLVCRLCHFRYYSWCGVSVIHVHAILPILIRNPDLVISSPTPAKLVASESTIMKLRVCIVIFRVRQRC